MHEEWTDKLSEYLDDELSAEERYAVESHLLGCASCTAVLNDLKRVIARAQAIDARPPQRDLWPGVAARIEPRAQAWRVSFSLPQALAASLVIALLSGAVAWQVSQRSAAERSAKASRSDEASRPETAATSTEREALAERSATRDAVPVGFADAQYDAAVTDLEKALRDGRGRLDKTTVSIVEHNLQIIDQAIEQARQALEGDPANDYLSSHLVEARRRKLDLLRRAAELTESN
jgi:Putative zinc-finger